MLIREGHKLLEKWAYTRSDAKRGESEGENISVDSNDAVEDYG